MVKYFYVFIILVSIFLSTDVNAQERREKTRAHKMYDKMQMALRKRNYPTAQLRLDSMMRMAVEDKDSLQIGYGYQAMASLAAYQGDYEKYEEANQKSLDVFMAMKNYDEVCLSYTHMAGSEREKGNIDKAFEYAFIAQKMLHLTKKQKTPIYNSNILSQIYKQIGQLDSSIYYDLEVIKQLNPKDSVGLSRTHSTLADSFNKIGNYKKQKEYLDIAHDYAMMKGLKSTRGSVYYDLSQYEIMHGDAHEALEMAHKSLEYYRGSKWKRSMISGYVSVASAYRATGEYDKAKIYIDSVVNFKNEKNLDIKGNYYLTKLNIEIAKGNLNNDQLLKDTELVIDEANQLQYKSQFYTLGSKYFRAKENYKLADNYNQKLEKVKEKLISRENRQIVNNLEAAYENEKKVLTISNLEISNSKQKQKLFGGGIALGLISLLSFFLFRLYKKIKGQKEVISKALSEKDILLREIHHRVKNNLQLVSSLLTLQGDSIDDATAQQAINEGKSRVRSMALIHQDLYNKENLTDIGVKVYLEKLTTELFYTYKIDKNKIQLNLDIEDIDLDVDTLVPMGLIINELITNCLKYAFPKDSDGILNVHLNSVSNELVLKVEDNGVGYNSETISNTSFGSTLISALTEQLEGELKIQSGNGTSIKITIPHSR